MLRDTDILQAVERLRGEWADLLGDDAADLAQRLGEVYYDVPESVRRTANIVLDLLERHPEAQARIRAELGVKGDLRELRGYDGPAGGPDVVPASEWLVCPDDRTHVRRRRRAKGQKLYCPQHKKELVPEHTLPAEE